MKIIDAHYQIISDIDGAEVLRKLERAGRVCYKSEDAITPLSAEEFIRKIIKKGHEAIIEHFSFSVKFVVDRGISHELVRHRLASYAQESTRYVDYSHGGEITYIKPLFFTNGSTLELIWLDAMESCELAYLRLRECGSTPEQARSVLPNSLKTEVVMTANLREWRHFFKLRTADAAHPQMREVTRPLLDEVKLMLPVIFDDIPQPWDSDWCKRNYDDSDSLQDAGNH